MSNFNFHISFPKGDKTIPSNKFVYSYDLHTMNTWSPLREKCILRIKFCDSMG